MPKGQKFQDKIQLNLANICASSTDIIKLVNARPIYKGFTCELCGHQHCVYAYTVKNEKTGIELVVGSECVHHFEPYGISIDIAEALMKRVIQGTNEARDRLKSELGEAAYNALPEEQRKLHRYWETRKMKEDLGIEAYKALSKEQKADHMVKAYNVVQAIDLLANVSNNTHTLSEEEIRNIVALGLQERLEVAQEQMNKRAAYHEYQSFVTSVNDYTKKMILTGAQIAPEKRAQFYSDFQKYIDSKMVNGPWQLDSIFRTYDSEMTKIVKKSEYEFLLNSSVKNPILDNIRAYYNKYKILSEAQVSLAKKIIDQTTSPSTKGDPEFEGAISWLMTNKPSSFIQSVQDFYLQKHYVSTKQRFLIMKIYGSSNK